MASIYLVRHGESDMNVTPLLSHRLADLPLTERGREQARLVARRLGETRLARIFTSPLQRARQTAACISERTGAPVRVEEALREIDCGDLDGRGDNEAWAATREIYRRWKLGEWEAPFPGGESGLQLCDRLADLLQGIAETYPDDDVAVVGHGGLFWFALPQLCGLRPESTTELLNTSVTVLRHHAGTLTCELWGCVAHLSQDA
jgi:broad specificity phosphatase PhoE